MENSDQFRTTEEHPLGINKDPLRSSTKPREVTTTILAPDVDGDICLERITD